MYCAITIDKNKTLNAFEKLPEKIQRLLKNSWAQIFRESVFACIETKQFEPLFEKADLSSPAIPADLAVGIFLLEEYLKKTDEEILESLDCDIRFQYALNTLGFDEQPVDKEKLECFRRSASEYCGKYGKDLIANELKQLKGRMNTYLPLRLESPEGDSRYKRLEKLINLSSKLVASASKNDDSFLSELLDMAMEQIPEADYGSISLVEDGLWRFVDARGHDVEALRAIPLKAEHKYVEGDSENLTYHDNGVILIDEILEKTQENMPESLFKRFAEASKPIRQSLVVELNFHGQYIGRIGLDIAKEKEKCFSPESPKILSAFGNMASAFLAVRQSYGLVDKLESLISLSSKLGTFAVEKDESFLSDLLEIAMALVPEADYGSISKIEGESWRFVDAVGHDISLLKSTPFKKDYFYDFSKDEKAPFVMDRDGNVVLVDYIVNNVEPKMPDEVHKAFQKASRPIQQSLIVQMNLNNEWAGHLGLDIAVGSHKKFTSESVRILNAFGNLASAFMAFQRLSSIQKDRQEQTNKRLRKSEEWNKVLELTVAERTMAVRNLLNNTGQGVLSFGRDLLVDSEYSSQCSSIFGTDIKGKNFAELIHPGDEELRDFFESTFKEIFNTDDTYRQSIYLSLLPEEFNINGKSMHLECKVLDDIENAGSRVIMAILTDITEKHELENRMEQEKNTLKMVVKVVANYNSFIECVRDYRNFYRNQMNEILKSKNSLKGAMLEIYRNIHTLKGNLSQFEMVNVTGKLHSFESRLSELIKRSDYLTAGEFKEVLSIYDMQSWLDLDMALLRGMLGDRFFKQGNMLIVDSTKVLEIEKCIINTLSPYDCRKLLPLVRRMRYQPFRELLRTYPEYVARLSEKLDIEIYPVEILGGENLADMDRYRGVAKALVHIFRNAVDHGIEAPEDRVNKGKDEYGTIRCEIKSGAELVEIIISDDGKGLDAGMISERAVQAGIYSRDEILRMSRESILNLVFVDGFSTKGEVTEMSGRGMGLSAVKNEVAKIGGNITLETETDVGTKFHLLLPYNEMNDLTELDIREIINPLIDTTKKFIMEHLNIDTASFAVANFERIQKLTLKEVTSFINVKGVLKGKFIMSMDEALIRNIVRNFVMGQLTEKEEEEYMEDTMAECSNIILGNSIKLFPHIEELITIETPITMRCENASIKYSESGIWNCSLTCEAGSVSISYLSSEIML